MKLPTESELLAILEGMPFRDRARLLRHLDTLALLLSDRDRTLTDDGVRSDWRQDMADIRRRER